MNALLTKNLMIIRRSFLAYFMIIFVLSLIGSKPALLALVLSAKLPLTIMSFDNQSKWNEVANTLPYSKGALNLNYFVLEYILILPVAVLTITSLHVLPLIGITPSINTNDAILAACGITIYMSACIPTSLYFGIEKGKIVKYAVFIVFMTLYDMLTSIPVVSDILNTSGKNSIIFLVIITIIINVISMFIAKNIKAKS